MARPHPKVRLYREIDRYLEEHKDTLGRKYNCRVPVSMTIDPATAPEIRHFVTEWRRLFGQELYFMSSKDGRHYIWYNNLVGQYRELVDADIPSYPNPADIPPVRQRTDILLLSDQEAIQMFQECYDRTKDECWLRFIEMVKRHHSEVDTNNATRELFEKADRYLRLTLPASAGSQKALDIMRKEYGWQEGDVIIADNGDPLLEAFRVAWRNEYNEFLYLTPVPGKGLGLCVQRSFWGAPGVRARLGIEDNVEVEEIQEMIAEIRTKHNGNEGGGYDERQYG